MQDTQGAITEVSYVYSSSRLMKHISHKHFQVYGHQMISIDRHWLPDSFNNSFKAFDFRDKCKWIALH